MSTDFHNFMRAGFHEAAQTFSSTDDAEVIRHKGKVATVVGGSLNAAEEMKNAGIQPEFDRVAVVLDDEFDTLGAAIESEVEIGGMKLEIKAISRCAPFVTLGLKEIR
ncbi:MAG TPA: hypothetical protein VNQ90_15600 [Chthoniobacteraceae bacterium]|nr:hypothetical protein [Chthoniobacteraceae bacterium]